MSDTTITMVDSEGNGVQLNVAPEALRLVYASEAVNLHMANGAAPTGVDLGVNDASYLVLGTHANLSNERVLTAGSNISFVDTGAGGTLTVASTGVGDADAQLLAWLGL